MHIAISQKIKPKIIFQFDKRTRFARYKLISSEFFLLKTQQENV